MSTARVVHWLTKLRASLWVIPALMTLGAIVLAVVVANVEARVALPPRVERFLFPGGPEGARAVLAAIAGSMIGVTGVTFSITIVALSLASTQLGPRLLRNFMRDRSNQVVLGALIATFLFALLGMRSVDAAEGGGGSAWLTIYVALGLSLGSLGLLIYFIHHISHGIQADVVIRNVASELEESIDRFFPEKPRHPPRAPPDAPPVEPEGESRTLHAHRSGYLQAVDVEKLLKVASRRNLVVRLERRPGDFIVLHAPLLRLWPADAADGKTLGALESAFLLGSRRTAEQDAEFLVDQLVEIAVRSLSPGINDPFTAMACIDRLAQGMCRLSRRQLPDPRLTDEGGTLRVVAERSTFKDVADSAFHMIRQYGAGSVPVTLRLLDALEVVARANEGDAPRLAVLRDHADRVLRSSRLARHEARDQEEIERRHAEVTAVLSRMGCPEGSSVAPA